MRLRGRLKELKKLKVAQHRADVNIGKNGIHAGLVEEIRRQLEAMGVVKIRILKNARQIVSEKDIYRLAEELRALVIDHRGYTFILAKRSLRTARR
ncbi:MAG: RNA-binding protein [Crenarchaeota archaeon]|nr:RNA-binding protein [Thermoproteota archaeon]